MTTRVVAFAVKHPSAALLFVQILGILVYALMEDTSAGRALFGVIGLLVLGAAIYVVKRGSWLTGFFSSARAGTQAEPNFRRCQAKAAISRIVISTVPVASASARFDSDRS